MNSDAKDLVIHYDHQQGRLRLYLTDPTHTEAIRQREFDGGGIEVDELRSRPAEDAEKSLGALVLSLLDLHAAARIGIRDYEGLAQQAHETCDIQWASEAAAGDAQAQHLLSSELYRQAVQNGSADDLEQAEALLRLSAERGCASAQESLNAVWPALKSIALRRMARDAKG